MWCQLVSDNGTYRRRRHLTECRSESGKDSSDKERAEGQGRIPVVPKVDEITGDVAARPDHRLAVDEQSLLAIIVERVRLELGVDGGG